jgi:hypothetical protein
MPGPSCLQVREQLSRAGLWRTTLAAVKYLLSVSLKLEVPARLMGKESFKRGKLRSVNLVIICRGGSPRGPEGEGAIYFVVNVWETIGVLVFKKELSLDLVDDFFGDPVVLNWQKLERYPQGIRDERQRQILFEWRQWLAERMMKREKSGPSVPANILHRNWKAQL